MKSTAGLPSHKREMSLDRFRDQLEQYKQTQNGEDLHVSTARMAKGHQKTRSDFNLSYFKKIQAEASSNLQNNYLHFTRSSKIDMEPESARLNFKKNIETKGKDVRKFQFDNIYNTKFSNLKKELQMFGSTVKSGPESKHEQNLNERKARKMLGKSSKSKFSSLTEQALQGGSLKLTQSIVDAQLLNRSKLQASINNQQQLDSARARHKYTKSEP